MKKVELVVLCLLLNWMSSVLAGETIRITNGEWPPYMSDKLKHNGVVSRITTEAFSLEGVKVEYGFFPWARAKLLVENGKWDGSIAWAKTPEREQIFHYSEALYDTNYVFFHTKDYAFDWSSVEDLIGIPIGTTTEYAYGGEFYDAMEAGTIVPQVAPQDELNFRKLLAGRIKLFPMNIDTGYYMIRTTFTPDEVEQLTHHPKSVFPARSSHLILSKKIERNERILALFNSGLEKLKASGKYAQFFEESRSGKYIMTE